MLPDSRQIAFVLFMGAMCTEYKRNVFPVNTTVRMWEMEQFWHARIHFGCPLHDF